jgi:murein L,D-transpeptidase YcbB/YkuD
VQSKLLDAGRGLSRRAFLKGSVGAAALVAGASSALAQAEWSGGGFDVSAPSAMGANAGAPMFTPQTAGYAEMAIQRYTEIAAYGGWPFVPGDVPLRIGVSHPNVSILRQRLMVTGDLAANGGMSESFDSFVEGAVRRFQGRHGLMADGSVGEDTFSRLNIPVQDRIAQLTTNVVRLRSMSGELGQRHVMVNVPAAEIETIEAGIVHSRHQAIVGKIDRQTPLLTTRVSNIAFNPFWTIPVSIIRADVIPAVQANPNYLRDYNIRVLDPRTGTELDPTLIDWNTDDATRYMLRQDPGEINSMGTVKINFPSPDGVYMHDTPSQSLFGENFRFHSSGCVRVQNVREYVTWLLKYTPGWENRATVEAALRGGERIDANLADDVNLYFVYVTAWASGDGVVQFRDDIYQRDASPEAFALQ